jgi:hypothetical protein
LSFSHGIRVSPVVDVAAKCSGCAACPGRDLNAGERWLTHGEGARSTINRPPLHPLARFLYF